MSETTESTDERGERAGPSVLPEADKTGAPESLRAPSPRVEIALGAVSPEADKTTDGPAPARLLTVDEKRSRRKRCEKLFAHLGAAPAAGGMLSEREQDELVARCYVTGADKTLVLVPDFKTKFRDWWIAGHRDKVAKATSADVRKRLVKEKALRGKSASQANAAKSVRTDT